MAQVDIPDLSAAPRLRTPVRQRPAANRFRRFTGLPLATVSGLLALLLSACATSYPQPRELTFDASLEVDLDAMVETSSGLFYRDLAVGVGEEAGRGDRVQVHYIGALPDGTVFERSTEMGPPVEFRLGAREVIRGWEEGIRGMREGGLRQLVIPPQLAYGGAGSEGIPSGATLVFQIQLVRVGGM